MSQRYGGMIPYLTSVSLLAGIKRDDRLDHLTYLLLFIDAASLRLCSVIACMLIVPHFGVCAVSDTADLSEHWLGAASFLGAWPTFTAPSALQFSSIRPFNLHVAAMMQQRRRVRLSATETNSLCEQWRLWAQSHDPFQQPHSLLFSQKYCKHAFEMDRYYFTLSLMTFTVFDFTSCKRKC